MRSVRITRASLGTNTISDTNCVALLDNDVDIGAFAIEAQAREKVITVVDLWLYGATFQTIQKFVSTR